jgi:endonuclease/exonuclease/phosphatase family metal-dependent hydrolase
VNCHLHHLIEDDKIRAYQAKNILDWINFENKYQENENNIIVFVGDFNAKPGSYTYDIIINSGYFSLYNEYHGNEPLKTFHNKMDAPFKDDDPESCFDYIL